MLTTFKKNQITIPSPIVRQLSIRVGTLFDCRVEAGQVVLKKIWEESEPGGGKVALSEPIKPFVLTCFGRFTLLHGGIPVHLERKKARELLAFLACEEGKPVRKGAAAAALWPGQTEGRSMDSLYKICTYLKALGEQGDAPCVRAARGSLWLELEQVECDLTVFRALTRQTNAIEDLRRAVELYRAPLLVEEGYEWTERLEGFYDMRYLDTVEQLRDYFRKLGRRDEAAYYQRLLLS